MLKSSEIYTITPNSWRNENEQRKEFYENAREAFAEYFWGGEVKMTLELKQYKDKFFNNSIEPYVLGGWLR